MVSKANEDFLLPLGPVTTVSFPRGRSMSMPLRLFCLAPRISTHPRSAGAVTHFSDRLAATFEPTGDNPRLVTEVQIYGEKTTWFRPRCRRFVAWLALAF